MVATGGQKRAPATCRAWFLLDIGDDLPSSSNFSCCNQSQWAWIRGPAAYAGQANRGGPSSLPWQPW